MPKHESSKHGCAHCRDLPDLPFDFSFAFQPIFDLNTGSAFSYEALVRGVLGEPALTVLDQVDDNNRYQFDQNCRIKAVTLAQKLGVECYLNINFYPNAVYVPESCIQTTLRTAEKVGFPRDKIVFEFLESEQIKDRQHLQRIVRYYQKEGFGTAIDDFGAGYAGLGLLAEYQPNFIKLDMALVRNVHTDLNRQAIIEGMAYVARKLNIELIAEGIEARGEAEFLYGAGIHLMQGYYFAKPGFELLPEAEAGSLLSWQK